VGDKSDIEWTDATWNVVRGCARVSPGCENCYAERQAHRFSAPGAPYAGLTIMGKHGPRWVGKARFMPGLLDQPLRWTRPRRVFVNSMSDLFHDDISFEQIAAIFGVMGACKQHTFQVLTKRPERMLEFFRWLEDEPTEVLVCQAARVLYPEPDHHLAHISFEHHAEAEDWPLPNVWLGVSVENQKRANERIPLLLEAPAAVRFISAEPLLDAVNLRPWLGTECVHDDAHVESDTNAVICRKCDEAEHLSWVIVGGESGPGARVCETSWIRRIVTDCAHAMVPCFVKQLGAKAWDGAVDIDETCGVEMFPMLELRSRKGGDPLEWPKDLRVRQYPTQPTAGES
jgi:protein gp37